MPDVVMPRLSDSMEEGTILKWLKAEGDQVERGEELVEIETDKATMPYEADTSGTLHIIAAEGDTLPIGQTIATIGEASPAAAAPAAAASKPEAAPVPARTAVAEPAQAAPAPAAAAPPVTPAPAPGGNGASPSGERVKASPVARRIARERGVNLQAVAGTGPGGRIVKADVEGAQPAAAAAPAAPAPAAAATPPPPPVVSETGTAKGDVRIEELSRMQQLVARRMAESRATVPDFTLTTAIDMERCVEMRADLKAATPEGGAVPSYNDMVVKACALALREFPRANGSYRDGHFELFSRVNVGVAVAAQDALVVPTVFDADSKSLGQIARDARALAERVRANAITPPELSGGTFTVSNLGMFGVTRFNAVINPPQAAILAVGALEQRAVVVGGAVVARHQMDVTLACDHRILYGADAARFLARVRELLEQPLALVL
jgi:pyruvate dehydrogenase E2 component (dihydrolipoamide acetyltransferase)